MQSEEGSVSSVSIKKPFKRNIVMIRKGQGFEKGLVQGFFSDNTSDQELLIKHTNKENSSKESFFCKKLQRISIKRKHLFH